MNAPLMDIGQTPMSPALAATLARAADVARSRRSVRIGLEHLLLALCDDPDGQAVIDASQLDILRLRWDVARFVDAHPGSGDGTPSSEQLSVSEDTSRILEAAGAAARGGRRRDIDGAIVLAAIVGDGQSDAAHILEAHGLTFDAAIRALQQAIAQRPIPPPAAPDRSQPAEDVLARARERIQARATPSLSGLMARPASTTASPVDQVSPQVFETTETSDSEASQTSDDVDARVEEMSALHVPDAQDDEHEAGLASFDGDDVTGFDAKQSDDSGISEDAQVVDARDADDAPDGVAGDVSLRSDPEQLPRLPPLPGWPEQTATETQSPTVSNEPQIGDLESELENHKDEGPKQDEKEPPRSMPALTDASMQFPPARKDETRQEPPKALDTTRQAKAADFDEPSRQAPVSDETSETTVSVPPPAPAQSTPPLPPSSPPPRAMPPLVEGLGSRPGVAPPPLPSSSQGSASRLPPGFDPRQHMAAANARGAHEGSPPRPNVDRKAEPSFELRADPGLEPSGQRGPRTQPDREKAQTRPPHGAPKLPFDPQIAVGQRPPVPGRRQDVSTPPLQPPQPPGSRPAQSGQMLSTRPPAGEHDRGPAERASRAIPVAKLLTSLPRKMRVGRTKPVKIRLPGNAVHDTLRPFLAATRGAPCGLAVRLYAPDGGVNIMGDNDVIHWLGGAQYNAGQPTDVVEWQFDIAPYERGEIPVTLVIHVTAPGPGGVMEEHAIADDTAYVRVRGNLRRGFFRMMGWLAMLAIGIAIGRKVDAFWATLHATAPSIIPPPP